MYFKSINNFFFISFLFFQTIAFNGQAQNRDIIITIHLRGVYESNISLLSLSDSRTFKPFKEVYGIKNGTTTSIDVLMEKLPGEFVLRFNYNETNTSTSYPSEKYIFINNQDLELWANPKYCNNADSTYFQKGENENSTFMQFSKENDKQKEKLGLLQNFLINYDDTESTFYKKGSKEYERRRKAYNQWLSDRVQRDKAFFVSNLYPFHYVPQIPWKGTETERLNSLINHYFDGMDFQNPLLIKTSDLNKWMDTYVNFYSQLATTITLQDSLFPIAGRRAIEKAKQGHPLVYGWMVDYFYRGYESNGITAGMKVLEPYMNDSNCLTSKRQEIARRLKGMETLISGSKTPDIELMDIYGSLFKLYEFEPRVKYLLILFWSAGCSHCVEMVNQLYLWQQQIEMQQKIQVVDISLDETETEIKAYQQKIMKLKGWRHLHAKEGVRSKPARDYFVLATPVMVLLDAKTKVIVAIPNTLNELMTTIH